MSDKQTPKPQIVSAQGTAIAEIPIHSLNIGERMLGKRTQLQIDSQREITPSVEDLAADIFWTLMKQDPEMPETPPEGRMANHALLKWMMGNTGFEDARRKAAGNLPAAMEAGRLIGLSLTADETYAEAMCKQEEAQEARQKAAAEMLAATAMQETMPEEAEQAKSRARAATGQAEKAEQAVSQILGNLGNDKVANATLHAASMAAGAEAEKIAAAMKGWGDETGNLVSRDPDAARRFMELYTHKIAEIAEIAGRMTGIALSSKEKIEKGGFTPNQAVMTQDLGYLFTTEAARLSDENHPVMQMGAWIDYLQNGLLGWSTETSGDQKGNFYVALDESGSMSGMDEIVSKGIALGLAKAAQEDDREYRIAAFASRYNDLRLLRSEQSWEDHLKWAETFINGGTDFDKPLRWIMAEMEQDGNGKMEAADVLFITDGWARLSPEVIAQWHDLQERTGAKLYYVPVMNSETDRSSQIAELADDILPVTNLTDPDEQKAIVQHLAGGML